MRMNAHQVPSIILFKYLNLQTKFLLVGRMLNTDFFGLFKRCQIPIFLVYLKEFSPKFDKINWTEPLKMEFSHRVEFELGSSWTHQIGIKIKIT